MLHDALIITRREIRDSLRDWRIVIPILILTLVFPYIMDVSTKVALNFVEQYNASIIPLRLVPFAMMIVGFFPISFSLVIALETFVGEKERNSLEPLLGAPLSDTSLYLGKLFAAMLPPLAGSYLGITSYLLGLNWSLHFLPEAAQILQIVLLTTIEGLVMVAGAVVVSSHTTSVRAANLLASFIIIPMAFLLQGESVLLFWGQYDVLWYILAGLIVVDTILVRMGIQTFNREAILSREIDELNLRGVVHAFWRYFYGPRLTLRGLYLQELPRLVWANRLPFAITSLAVAAGIALGWAFGIGHPLPAEFWGGLTRLSPTTFSSPSNLTGASFLPRLETGSIFLNNARSLALGAVLGLFTFGAGALLLLMTPVALVGFFAEGLASAGSNPFLFLLAFVLPHGILELPAAILATGMALKLAASLMSRSNEDRPVGDNLLQSTAEFVRVFVFLVLPLLLGAAFVEAHITPELALALYGGK